MTTTRRFKLTAINDDQDTCMCCGKPGLKRVAWLRELDADGNFLDEIHVGTTCAAVLLGYTNRVPGKRIKASAEREVIKLYIFEKMRQMLAVGYKVTVTTTLAKFGDRKLRGATDNWVMALSDAELAEKTVDGTFERIALCHHGKPIYRYMTESNFGPASELHHAARALTDNLMFPIRQEWYTMTGLSNFISSNEMPEDLRDAVVTLEEIN